MAGFKIEQFMGGGTPPYKEPQGSLVSDPALIQNAAWLAGLVNSDVQDSTQVSALAYVITAIAREFQRTGAGGWTLGVDYPKGALVLYSDGLRYIATAPNTAKAANAPDQVGAPWIEYELWQRDKMMPIGYIYLNKTNPTNPAALANPWPGSWAALRANDYLAIQGGRYKINTRYSDGLPNITGRFISAVSNSGWQVISPGALKPIGVQGEDAAGTNRDSSGFDFDASRSNPIYNHDQEKNGNPDPHVQPQTQSVVGFVKTAFAY